MENINSLNNFNITNGTISSQKANLVGQESQSAPKNMTEAKIPFQNFEINQSFIYNSQNLIMDNETIFKYLQNLLKLPNSIEKFINEFISNNKNPKTLELLGKNLLDIEELGNFLNQNSQKAVEKLMQTISAVLKSGSFDTAQLREILSVLNTIQTKTDINTNTLKELLLLYIPINIEAFNKEINFIKANKDIEEKINSSMFSIMLETINFSNVLCCINEEKNKISVDLYAAQSFPYDKFSLIIKEFSKEGLLNTSLNFIKIKENEANSKTQNFKVVSKGYIPINILLFAHLIIKTVFKIDSDFTI